MLISTIGSTSQLVTHDIEHKLTYITPLKQNNDDIHMSLGKLQTAGIVMLE